MYILEAKIDVITISNDESPVTLLQTFEDFQTTVWEVKINQRLQATYGSLITACHQVKLSL